MLLRRLTAVAAVRGSRLAPVSSAARSAADGNLLSPPEADSRSTHRGLSKLALAVFAAITTQPVIAAEDGAIEEVIVTAQRSAESIQDVPIAVTALSGEMLEDRQIIAATDLQMNAPNVSFTSTNFGGSSFSIRGIGRLVISSSGEAGVSTHINEIPINSNLNAVEYFDVQRVEVLRGPQGTLFGRNATGGAINMVANMPEYEGMKGFVDVELGDYNHQRVKGMFNMPFGDNFAVRVAGMQLQRDGYIDNVAFGQTDASGNRLVGINDDVDGRDLWSARITASWEITDNARAWLMYSQFDEDDDRARITNQVCEQNPLPTQGCLPNGFGFEAPHLGSTTGGLFGGFFGALPLGDPGNGAPGSIVNYDFPRPTNIDFRDMHTDFEPIFENEEEIWAGGFTYEFENFSVGLLGAYQETDYLAQQDYNMDVGPTLNDIGIGGYPTSAPAGRAGEDWTSGECNYNAGTSGLNGGCVAAVD
ncbi:MAG: TonB-dependent receptor, partial [Pseudomonadota bacterium]